MIFKKIFLILSFVSLFSMLVKAEEVYRAPVIEVIGETSEDLKGIPGSGTVVKKKDLEKKKPVNLEQVVKQETGVHVREEDGAGLIPNIGIRGLSPDRSEKVLILEDGMPAGLSLYIEAASYYIPPIERIERIEILKGSGSILHGPQTVGGVINLITPDVPQEFLSQVQLIGGTDAYVLGRGRIGKTWNRFGFDFSFLHKQGNGFKDSSDFRVTNLTTKMRYSFSEKTNLTLKINFHNQESSQTYLGLTQALFEEDSDFNPAPDDSLKINRWDANLSLQHFFSPTLELLTHIYYSNTVRDWNRQDFSRNTDFADAPGNTVRTIGDTALDGGAIYMLSSFGSRDRNFQFVGVEPRLFFDYSAFGKEHKLQTGFRLHWEKLLDELNTTETLDADSVNQDRDTRFALAFSTFAQNTFNITDKLALIPGFRLEIYNQTRKTDREDYVDVDFENSVLEIVPIPGLGLTYQLPKETTLFSGIHRGFAPPRTSQAISSTGEDLELDSETSWNFEAGVRTNPVPWFQFEGTFFYIYFENQVIPDSESGGASNTLTNAGETRHVGFETAASINLLGASSNSSHLWLKGNYTFVDAENVTDGGIFEGNELPYAPKHMLNAGLHFSKEEGFLKGFDLGFEANFISSQFADQENTEEESIDGTVGKIDSRTIFNAYARYALPSGHWDFSLLANNIFDAKYIASRAPQGIFPGAGFQMLFGVTWKY